jgi:hypothetical protein
MSPESIADGDGQSFLLWGNRASWTLQEREYKVKECIASEVLSVGCFANS